MIDLPGLAAVLSALGGVIIAIGTIILNRQKQRVADVDDMELELELCSEVRGIALRHIRTLERGYADFDQTPPPRPPELRPGYSGRAAGGAGRHRARGAGTDAEAENADA